MGCPDAVRYAVGAGRRAAAGDAGSWRPRLPKGAGFIGNIFATVKSRTDAIAATALTGIPQKGLRRPGKGHDPGK